MRSRKLSGMATKIAATCALAFLAGCGRAALETPTYYVNEVDSFKIAGAPSRVMMLEIHDANHFLPDAVWADALSNHGFPPRLTFITDPAQIGDNQMLKPKSRVVAVVNPTASTMAQGLCNAPESLELPPGSELVVVRIGFCSSDSIISETRARFHPDQFRQQLIDNGDTINYMLFPRNMRDNEDRRCNPMISDC